MRIFVAGATGVIGRRVVPLLIARGHQVSALARDPGKRAWLRQCGAAAVDVDLFAPSDLRTALYDHDAVINLATHLPAGWRMFMPGAWAENDRIRSIASANLVEAALAGGARCFIQESFAPVYPDGGEEWIDETTPIAPVRYNRSVADAERAAQHFTKCGGAGIVLRLASFYGADAWQTRETVAAVRRGWAPLPGSPDSFVSSICHDDAATAVVAALNGESGAYNVSDDEPMRRRDYFDELAKVLAVPPPSLPPAWVGTLMGSLGTMLARSLRISNRKLREQLGWSPRFSSMREGWPAVVAAMNGRRFPSDSRTPT